METIYLNLFAEHEAFLQSQRAIAKDAMNKLAGRASDEECSLQELQNLYDIISAPNASDLVRFAEPLGVFFGDELIKIGKYEWVTVEDEYGIDPVVGLIGFKAHASAIDIIKKRVINFEFCSIENLLLGIKKDLDKMIYEKNN